MGDEGTTANFCGACGEPIHGGRFCSNCGTRSGVHQAVRPAAVVGAPQALTSNGDDGVPRDRVNAEASGAPAEAGHFEAAAFAEVPPAPGRRFTRTAGRWPPATQVPSAAPARSGSRHRGLVAGLAAGAVLLVAAAVAAVVLTSGSDGTKQTITPDTAYRQKVAAAFGTVLGANRQLSDALARLHGTHPTNARVAVGRAQRATTVAVGALSALTVPPDSQPLAGDARQVLDREAAYLSSVAEVLRRPTVAGAGHLQTLASNLTSALDSAGPTVAGTAQTVSGADRLTSWAQTTERKLRRQAARRTAAARRSRSAGGSAAPPPSVSNGNAGGRDCGGGLHAGPNTSCEFARNVRDAYNEAPGAAASVRAFSPATGSTYTMDCRPSGSGVTCSGANNASVTF